MRITSSMMMEQLEKSTKAAFGNMSDLQTRLSTGRNIDKPSDDVAGMSAIMDYTLSISSNDQFKTNMTGATAQLNIYSNVMSAVSDTLQRLKELAVSGASGTPADASRTGTVAEVTGLRDYLLDLSNAKSGDGYIFSGYKTETSAFDPSTFAYQGDDGKMNVMTDKFSSVQVNVIGSSAFAYSPVSPEVVQLDSGKYVHYIPGVGTTVNVEIRDSNDTTVLDSFSYSNDIHLADTLGSALSSNNTLRVQALMKPLDEGLKQANKVQADIAARLGSLSDQSKRTDSSSLALKNSLSKVQDVDIPETVAAISQSQIALEALLQSSSKIFSQSLLDFLK